MRSEDGSVFASLSIANDNAIYRVHRKKKPSTRLGWRPGATKKKPAQLAPPLVPRWPAFVIGRGGFAADFGIALKLEPPTGAQPPQKKTLFRLGFFCGGWGAFFFFAVDPAYIRSSGQKTDIQIFWLQLPKINPQIWVFCLAKRRTDSFKKKTTKGCSN